jgi:micrococcal nuclease
MLYRIDLIESLAAAAIGVALALSFGSGMTSERRSAAILQEKSQEKSQEVSQFVQGQFSDPRPIKPRIPVEVLRVIDGDTVEVRAQIWLDQHITTKVRIRSIDAPELQSRCAQERTLAAASRDHLLAILGENKAYLTDLGYDKFGARVLGNLLTSQGQDVSAMMLTDGHARTYKGGRRNSWC